MEAALSRTVRILLITALAVAGSAPAAGAATPFTAGVGEDPSVAVGADGTGHVAWATTEDDGRVGLRRFDPGTDTSGAVTYVEGADGIDDNILDYPDSYQGASGRLHVL
jgi:hypothetical protein